MILYWRLIKLNESFNAFAIYKTHKENDKFKTIVQTIIIIEDKPIIIILSLVEIKIKTFRTEIFLKITIISKTLMSIIVLTMHSSLCQKYNALNANALAISKMIVA